MRYFYSFLFVLVFFPAKAQKTYDRQLWVDYQIAYPFANVYLFDAELNYQNLLSNQNQWRCYGFTPELQRTMSNRIDIILSTPLYYTNQTNNYNTFEFRISPAARYTFTTGGRVESRAVLRYDHRYVKPEDAAGQISNRIRPGIEFLIPINRKTYFEDKQLFAILDTEAFLVMDQNVKERFANLVKARIGLGYRLNYTYRFNIIYQVQQSRQTVDQPFDSQDNILRIRFVMFFNNVKKVLEAD